MKRTVRAIEWGGPTTRRDFLVALSALTMAPKAVAQSSKPQIAWKSLNHVTFAVSEIQRSLKFYQALFGMWNYARQDATPLLQIGSGPRSLGLRARDPEETGLGQLCLGVEGFNADEIMKTLAAHGVARTKTPGTAAMTAWVRMRAGTPEVFFNDPNSLLIQLQDVSYCGGSGAFGEKCPPQPREQMMQPSTAPIRLHSINHLIIFVADPERARMFWRDLFGVMGGAMGPAPNQFLGFMRGTSARPRLDHLCLGMENFEAEGVMKRLLEFGLKEHVGGTVYGLDGGPLMARAFPRAGHVEIYVTDPDNNVLQLSDVNYCSGTGRLGTVCRP
jgi:catechol 2,3-dioxygenase-like lactoylglutathione lyase family enzyme